MSKSGSKQMPFFTLSPFGNVKSNVATRFCRRCAFQIPVLVFLGVFSLGIATSNLFAQGSVADWITPASATSSQSTHVCHSGFYHPPSSVCSFVVPNPFSDIPCESITYYGDWHGAVIFDPGKPVIKNAEIGTLLYDDGIMDPYDIECVNFEIEWINPNELYNDSTREIYFRIVRENGSLLYASIHPDSLNQSHGTPCFLVSDVPGFQLLKFYTVTDICGNGPASCDSAALRIMNPFANGNQKIYIEIVDASHEMYEYLYGIVPIYGSYYHVWADLNYFHACEEVEKE